MKIYVPYHSGGAGSWIYEGYFGAWNFLGYDVEYYNSILDIDTPEEYMVMAVEGALNHSDRETRNILGKAKEVFMFVQPHKFPEPWGMHPNFISMAPDDFVEFVNSTDNIHLWSFADTSNVNFWDKWKTVNYVPLAFDSVNYIEEVDEDFKYDICYVGGTANNGFDEKRKIMSEYFSALENLNIKMGIFINCNISRQEESTLLCSSKISLNIHDRYQHVLGLDCNERTFKSLGLNGFLISDKVKILDGLNLKIPQANSPEEMCTLVTKYLDLEKSSFCDIKTKNKERIIKDHTYVERVKYFLSHVVKN